MSAAKIDSRIDLNSPDAVARAAHNRGLAEKLRADVATAALGGTEKSRDRHTSRGKLLPASASSGCSIRARPSSRLASSPPTISMTARCPARV